MKLGDLVEPGRYKIYLNDKFVPITKYADILDSLYALKKKEFRHLLYNISIIVNDVYVTTQNIVLDITITKLDENVNLAKIGIATAVELVLFASLGLIGLLIINKVEKIIKDVTQPAIELPIFKINNLALIIIGIILIFIYMQK